MKKINMIFPFVTSFALLFFCSVSVAIADVTAVSVATPTQAMGKTLFVLFGIITLIVGLAWLAKRFGVNGLAGQKDIKTLAQIPLGQREKAVLIEVHGRKILLGVAQGNVNTLYVFNDLAVEQVANAEFSADESNESNEMSNAAPKEVDDRVKTGSKDGAQIMNISGLNLPVLFRSNKAKNLPKNTANETSEFADFLKKIISNGSVGR